MEEKVLCDRCFKNVRNDETVYKTGSAVYCGECHKSIEAELLYEEAKKCMKDFEEDEQAKFETKSIPFLREEIRKEIKNEYIV